MNLLDRRDAAASRALSQKCVGSGGNYKIRGPKKADSICANKRQKVPNHLNLVNSSVRRTALTLNKRIVPVEWQPNNRNL